MESNTNPPDLLTPESEIDTTIYQRHIRNARVIIFIIAGLQILSMFLLSENEGSKILIAVTIGFVAMLFIAYGVWSFYQPFPALVTTLATYLLLIGINAWFDPATLVQGIVLKLAAIALLILGIRNAKELDSMKESYQ